MTFDQIRIEALRLALSHHNGENVKIVVEDDRVLATAAKFADFICNKTSAEVQS